MLCEGFGLPKIPVLLRSGGATSHYKPYDRVRKGPAIKMLPSMLQARTACHEWAHYAHHMEYKKSGWIGPRKVHGDEHKMWMERAVAYVKGTTLYQTAQNATRENRLQMLQNATVTMEGSVMKVVATAAIPTQVMDFSMAAEAADPIQAAFNALPEILGCPKCGCDKPKTQFGVRVMSRDANGAPKKISRQSYCRGCR